MHNALSYSLLCSKIGELQVFKTCFSTYLSLHLYCCSNSHDSVADLKKKSQLDGSHTPKQCSTISISDNNQLYICNTRVWPQAECVWWPMQKKKSQPNADLGGCVKSLWLKYLGKILISTSECCHKIPFPQLRRTPPRNSLLTRVSLSHTVSSRHISCSCSRLSAL